MSAFGWAVSLRGEFPLRRRRCPPREARARELSDDGDIAFNGALDRLPQGPALHAIAARPRHDPPNNLSGSFGETYFLLLEILARR